MKSVRVCVMLLMSFIVNPLIRYTTFVGLRPFTSFAVENPFCRFSGNMKVWFTTSLEGCDTMQLVWKFYYQSFGSRIFEFSKWCYGRRSKINFFFHESVVIELIFCFIQLNYEVLYSRKVMITHRVAFD